MYAYVYMCVMCVCVGRRVAVLALYRICVTSRRLNLHASELWSIVADGIGRHATCSRTMHRSGFGRCRTFFSLVLTERKRERQGENLTLQGVSRETWGGQISILLPATKTRERDVRYCVLENNFYINFFIS